MNLLEQVIATVPSLAERISGLPDYHRESHSSHNRDAYRSFFQETIVPSLRAHNKDLKPLLELHLQLALGELYANAIIHGNQAGIEDDYDKRNQPVPEDVEENRKKIVTMEAFVGKGYCVLAVEDEGTWEGLDEAVAASQQTTEEALSGRGLGIVDGAVNHYLMIDGKVVIVRLF